MTSVLASVLSNFLLFNPDSCPALPLASFLKIFYFNLHKFRCVSVDEADLFELGSTL